MGTIAVTTSDEEETEDESDRAALLQNQINGDGSYLGFIFRIEIEDFLSFVLEIQVLVNSSDEHQFDILEKVEMVSARRCDARYFCTDSIVFSSFCSFLT